DCVGSCVGVECAGGQRCVDGSCETDRCAGVECNERRFCDEATGSCVDDECFNVNCAAGYVCEPRSGDCVEDPCSVTRCPEGQVCETGVCDMPRDEDDEPSADAGVGKRIFATGGGGLICSAPGAGGPGGGLGWLELLIGGGVLLAVSRRRFGRAAPTACASVLALALGGCEVDPYCLDCPSPGADRPDSAVDAGWITYDGGIDGDGGGVDDGGEPDGCTPGAPELCNDHDDDCDGDIDEGVDLTSPAHCGSCENVCNLPHTFPSCVDGVCGVDRCDVGFQDLDGEIANGCEYGCLPTGESDDDCDGLDDDCDGEDDEDVDLDTDPDHCGACGERCRYVHAAGACEGGECRLESCEEGFYDEDEDPATGCEYSCGPPAQESCNGRDDDCDGDVDEGNPDGGDDCGSDVGECRRGVLACQGGQLVCDGEIAPTDELCNLEDDDCDDEIDEDDPEGGAICGTDEGDCVAGRVTCMAGDLVCAGEVVSSDEECDAHDNDCDGSIDEGNPGGGGACGDDTGACAEGTERCVGGVIVCQGGTGPRIETCNGVDDDCDGPIDEGFDFDTDLDNCGGCGIECEFDNAFATCDAGDCEIFACRSGFVDRNGNPDDGCELECDMAGAEVCNGRDDDCNGLDDDGLVPPANFCNPNGACANTTPECEGSDGWVCDYGPGVQEDADGDIVPETRCDGVDNDCDGLVDEADPLKGTPCFNGIGICRRGGVYICDAGDAEAPVVCNAPPAGDPGVETCNGLDDDCNGLLDDDITDDMVQVAANLWVFRYEASRPDATVDDQGTDRSRACSSATVLPWTDVTWDEANDACADAGKRLCTQAEWQDACNSVTNNCLWSYDATAGFACQPASAYNGSTCNGNNYDFDPLTAGDQDGLLPTSSLAHCGSDELAGGGLDLVRDLSGNAKEWTSTDPAGGAVEYRIMGGSYNNPAGGLRCDFTFTVGEPDFHFPNVGFRCCSSVAP
ncbi:MAG: SUMF1/EgtB/PvdO family nonheme iron enzyme, partial [Deltaproteobacteria bacterium]|nr:SUMF1/EgtB/PvdO family nonheme iron enzyme [Deltaproteobacteria bacterium]